MSYRNKKNYVGKSKEDQMKVFSDSVDANDIRQGALGNCYLLSAMSVIAHSRPNLLKKIFHPACREYRKDGAYVVMMYSGGKPVLITVDDFFAANNNQAHPYVKVTRDKDELRSIWPMIVEKAYAKMFGGYPSTEGGPVDGALADLTNGVPQRLELDGAQVKEWHTTGVFWEKLRFW